MPNKKLEKLISIVLMLVEIFMLFSFSLLVVSFTPWGHDDTDNVPWGLSHSGIASATDALTGCQYLKSPGGGITKRLNKAGEHVGCEK